MLKNITLMLVILLSKPWSPKKPHRVLDCCGIFLKCKHFQALTRQQHSNKTQLWRLKMLSKGTSVPRQWYPKLSVPQVTWQRATSSPSAGGRLRSCGCWRSEASWADAASGKAWNAELAFYTERENIYGVEPSDPSLMRSLMLCYLQWGLQPQLLGHLERRERNQENEACFVFYQHLSPCAQRTGRFQLTGGRFGVTWADPPQWARDECDLLDVERVAAEELYPVTMGFFHAWQKTESWVWLWSKSSVTEQHCLKLKHI